MTNNDDIDAKKVCWIRFFKGTLRISKGEEYLWSDWTFKKHGPKKMQGELNYSSIPKKLVRGSGSTICIDPTTN